MRRLIHPEYFQGLRQKKRYFEGWYFKCISADQKRAIAVIPGIAINPQGDRHAFIQVIDAVSGKTCYFHFPYSSFKSPSDRFAVQIGENRFDSTGISLNVQTAEGRISGRLAFSDAHPFPTRWYNPGIMGPFTFIPFMECYHAIIHLYHTLHGTIELAGEVMDFSGGTGYIEKDYGHSFPKTYLWLQASHFDCGEASFVFSQARIPIFGTEFPGFFAYFTDFGDVACRFATYNRSRLTGWQVDPAGRTCSGELQGPAGKLRFDARMAGGGSLRAPVDGLMDRVIIESISARVQVTVTDNQGIIRYQGKSSEAGMEICY
jgi:tocopherol cyclase